MLVAWEVNMKTADSPIITLTGLSFATFLYSRVSRYDDSLAKLHEQTGNDINLLDEQHIRYVLQWLRKWKCRNLELRFEDMTIKSIKRWFEANRSSICLLPNEIRKYESNDLLHVAAVFEQLSESMATPRKRIGSTAAAKILYLVKPKALPPWDDLIKSQLGHNGSGKSYSMFVENCRKIAESINQNCIQAGVSIDDIIQHGRQKPVGIAKAIDEYYWITITSKLALPSDQEIEVWRKITTARQL
jgi:hypothetical protein